MPLKRPDKCKKFRVDAYVLLAGQCLYFRSAKLHAAFQSDWRPNDLACARYPFFSIRLVWE
jgi:hypothetical protein